jgi:8-amino-7-oxononanoate synthase
MPRFPISQATATTVTISGRELVSFGGCNYLGLAHHPDVLAAVAKALTIYGLSTSASRETTGNTLAHDALEYELARFLQTESAVVVPDGYTANLALVQALGRDHKLALIDRMSHRSIRAAIAASGMTLMEYDHLDAAGAARLVEHQLLRDPDAGVVIITDGVFAAEGSIAPVASLLEALPARRGVLVIDDCHGFCVLGPKGQGLAAQAGLHDPRVVITTSLAKGLGCHGGVIAATRQICETVRTHGNAYVGTTPTSAAVISGAIEALAIVEREPERLQRLRDNTAHLADILRAAGITPVQTTSPIFAFTIGTEQQMRRLHSEMLESGILVPLITYANGPAPLYFRVSVNSEHTAAQLEMLGVALGRRLRRVMGEGNIKGQVATST